MAVTDIAGSRGIAFLVGATLMADMIAKACSSPQTVETNAGRRADTAMKWATIGLLEGVVFIVIAAYLEPGNAMAFISGGALEGAVTYFEYQHAKQAGLASDEPGTEDQEGAQGGLYVYSQA
jgi:hypothetical protein